MVVVFHCPACGARLSADEGETTVQCLYCRNSVAMPPDLQRPESPGEDYPSPYETKPPRRTLTRKQSRFFLAVFGVFFGITFMSICVPFGIPALVVLYVILVGIVSALFSLVENLLHIFLGG